MAYLDQQEAHFAEVADEFANYYGFTHDCHCGQDYAAGRVIEIPMCYAEMCGQAMEACAILKRERDQLLELAEALTVKLSEVMNVESSDAGADSNGGSSDEGTGNGNSVQSGGAAVDDNSGNDTPLRDNLGADDNA